jgi:hypothetical protein
MGFIEELTNEERRLVLAALWRFRDSLGHSFDTAGMEDWGDAVHEIATMNTLDRGARKLGGDPAKHLYGTPEY